MASVTIRNLDDEVKARLRVRAALHGRSMEEEARNILRSALANDAPAGTGAALARALRARFATFGGVDLPLPPRDRMREPPDFGSPAFDP
ncbi:MAG: plasmid stabilization protein [Xanthomonadaceae bacterium]|nr:plasmid stabilization protein [Xanthomonadaceae bacterium]